jgi:hypothetical protein
MLVSYGLIDQNLYFDMFNPRYNDRDDMPFGHDVADPFSYPYIKYRSTKEEIPCTE